MNTISQNQTMSFKARFLRLILLNLGLMFPIGLGIWWFQTSGDRHLLAGHMVMSFIHSNVYGMCFGLTMRPLGERLGAIRFPLNWISIIGALLLITILSTFIIQICLAGLGFLEPNLFWIEWFFKSVVVMAIASIIATIVGVYDTYRDRMQATNLQLRTQELEKERALKLATEARLASLESRLHPHFLFNTLNSISALISEDPALAEQMVQRLSSLLRKSLDAFSNSRVPLSEEIKLVTDYLEIEKVRFRDRLSYSIDVDPTLTMFEVPPLTLQPLVENSIKHAIAPRPSGGTVRISARLDDNQLVLDVWDDGPGFDENCFIDGHGLDSLRARLGSIIGDQASLKIEKQQTGIAVAIRLPLAACAGISTT
jgi:sensor histidine kinase YesM